MNENAVKKKLLNNIVQIIENNNTLIINIIWILIFLFGSFLFFYKILHEGIWYDESYSAMIIRHPIPDIIKIIVKDNHPPLYFVLLKIFGMIFGNSVLALRLFSVIGAICLAALGPWLIRRICGVKTALLYSFFVFTSPIIFSFAQEIRMYTWACFFVTSTALYGNLIIHENRIKNYILFGLFCLASAYIHYYALIAIVIINIYLFIWIIINDKKRIKYFILMDIIILLFYLPWIIIFFKQVLKVLEDYWIEPLRWYVIWDIINLPFSLKNFAPNFYTIIGSILFYIFIVFGFVKILIERKKKNRNKLIKMCIFTYFLTLFLTIFISLVLKTILIERYIFVVYGLLLIAISSGIMKINKIYIQIVCVFIIMICSISQISLALSMRINGPIYEIVDFLNNNSMSTDVFLHSSEHPFGIFSFYYPEHEHYLYLQPGHRGYSNFETFASIGQYGTDIRNFLKGKKRVWVFDFIESEDRIPLELFEISGELIKSSVPKEFIDETNKYYAFRLTLYIHP